MTPALWERVRTSVLPGAASPDLLVAALAERLGHAGPHPFAGLRVLIVPRGDGRLADALTAGGADVVAPDDLPAASAAPSAAPAPPPHASAAPSAAPAPPSAASAAPSAASAAPSAASAPLPDGGGFALVLHLGDVASRALAPAADPQRLARLRAALAPGGRLVLHALPVEVVARHLTPVRYHEAGGYVVQTTSSVCDDWSTLRLDLRLYRDGDDQSATLDVPLASCGMIRAALHTAGFVDVRCFGGWDGRPFGPDATGLLVVAEA